MRSGAVKTIKVFRQQVLCIVFMLLVGCTQAILPPTAPSPDPTLEELISLYRKQQDEIPPLKGLMKVTITDKIDQGFWAKWHSQKGTIEIDGYDLFGGTLFKLRMSESKVSLASQDNNFQGSRKELEQYLISHDSLIRIEWLTLLDWIARGGLPDLSMSERPTLRKDVSSKGGRYLVLSFSKQDVWIEQKSLRIVDVMFYNLGKFTGMRLSDYRPVGQIFFPFFIRVELHDTNPMLMEIVFKEVKVMTE
jgi:outer membrane biogenesis lipoprotein LolB